MSHSLRRIAAVLAVGLLALAGCGDDDPAESTGTTEAAEDDDRDLADLTGQDEVTVQARDNVFELPDIRVSAGTTVRFENKGRNDHNVVPVDDGAFEAIEVEDLEPGESASITFDEPGDYRYYCTLHGTETKGMVGSVVVET